MRLESAFRSGREPEQEIGFEVVNEASVRPSGGVVELIHDDVIEAPRTECAGVIRATERLDGSKENVRFRHLLGPRVVPEDRVGADAPVRFESLPGATAIRRPLGQECQCFFTTASLCYPRYIQQTVESRLWATRGPVGLRL